MPEVRKHIVISQNFPVNTAYDISVPIILNFIPDKVILREGGIISQGGTRYYTVQTDLINDPVLCVSPNLLVGTLLVYNSEFILNKPVNGNYRFYCSNQTGGIDISQGFILLHLEFIKYE